MFLGSLVVYKVGVIPKSDCKNENLASWKWNFRGLVTTVVCRSFLLSVKRREYVSDAIGIVMINQNAPLILFTSPRWLALRLWHPRTTAAVNPTFCVRRLRVVFQANTRKLHDSSVNTPYRVNDDPESFADPPPCLFMSKMNVDEFHCIHGHAGEHRVILAAKRSGVELVGEIKPCVLRFVAKRVLRDNIHNTSRADKYEIREGGTRARTRALDQPRATGPLVLLRSTQTVW